jgi:hypothetical protein
VKVPCAQQVRTDFSELKFCRVSGSADGGQRRLRFYERLLINRCPFDQVTKDCLSDLKPI